MLHVTRFICHMQQIFHLCWQFYTYRFSVEHYPNSTQWMSESVGFRPFISFSVGASRFVGDDPKCEKRFDSCKPLESQNVVESKTKWFLLVQKAHQPTAHCHWMGWSTIMMMIIIFFYLIIINNVFNVQCSCIFIFSIINVKMIY